MYSSNAAVFITMSSGLNSPDTNGRSRNISLAGTDKYFEAGNKLLTRRDGNEICSWREGTVSCGGGCVLDRKVR